jgi:hypothetical protein
VPGSDGSCSKIFLELVYCSSGFYHKKKIYLRWVLLLIDILWHIVSYFDSCFLWQLKELQIYFARFFLNIEKRRRHQKLLNHFNFNMLVDGWIRNIQTLVFNCDNPLGMCRNKIKDFCFFSNWSKSWRFLSMLVLSFKTINSSNNSISRSRFANFLQVHFNVLW